MSDFKIFWRWTMNHYNQICMNSSLQNYWQVLRMHFFDKMNQNFDSFKRRNIHNVRCFFLQLETFHINVSDVSIYQLAHWWVWFSHHFQEKTHHWLWWSLFYSLYILKIWWFDLQRQALTSHCHCWFTHNYILQLLFSFIVQHLDQI